MFALFLAVGLKRGLKLSYRYPAILLTPLFSFWTFGSAEKSCCGCPWNGKSKKIQVSFTLSYINMLISLPGYCIWALKLMIDIYSNFDSFDHPPFYSFLFIGLFGCWCWFFVFQVLPMLLLQFLDRCSGCCSACCLSCCFPVIEPSPLNLEEFEDPVELKDR